MVAAGLQTFLPRGVELTARLTAPTTREQDVKIERKGRDNRQGSGEKVKCVCGGGTIK